MRWPLPRSLTLPLLVPLILLLIGTVGYRLIEGPEWSWFDALYMTAISITTVGFLEVHELSTSGRAFTIFLCFGGIFTLFFAATEFIRMIVNGELQIALGRQQMERTLSELKGHMIVCGFGRMGQFVCEEFERQKQRYVIVDRNEDTLSEFRSDYGVPLHGDATSDDVLRRAGAERARALVTVAASDADNLYITLSARLLNESLFIVARAEDEGTEPKLRRVGANQVVSPYLIGGRRVAYAVLRPTVTDFLELATRTEHLDLQIEEVKIARTSRLSGVTLSTSRIHPELGIIVVAIQRGSGEMIYNPPGDAVLEADSTLIVLGRREQLDELELRAKGA
jgi:voltage-gated potassium channel